MSKPGRSLPPRLVLAGLVLPGLALPCQTMLILVAVLPLGCGVCPTPAPDPDLFDSPVLADLADAGAEAWIRSPTRRIDLGSPQSRHRLVSGFSVPEVDPDHGGFAWSLGDSSVVAFDAVARRDLPFELRGGPAVWRDGPDQVVTVWVNDVRVRRFPMRPGVRTYSAIAPEEALRPGRNLLRLEYAWTRSPRDRDPASADDRPLAVAWYGIDFHTPETEPDPIGPSADGDDLTLPAGVETVLYFDAEPAAAADDQVEVWLTADDLDFDRAGRWLDVRWSWDGPGGEVVRSGRLQPDGRSDCRSDGLSDAAGRAAIRLRDLPVGENRPHAVELTLTVRPASQPGSATLRRPAVRLDGWGETVRKGEGTATGGPGSPEDAPEEAGPAEATGSPERSAPPLVLLYVIDTLRADHLGVYGHAHDVSPHLDAFAAGGVVFEHAVAQSSWTRSSMASLVTGVVPTRHGVHDRDDALSLRATTLAEAFRNAGYRTAGWTANGNVGDQFGFGQGFDAFGVVPTAAPGDPAGAGEVQAHAAGFLDSLRADRGFLLLHTMEPHSPYWPEARPASELGVDLPVPPRDETLRGILSEVAEVTSAPMPSSLRMGSTLYLQAMETRALDHDPALVDRLQELYDAEIRTVDAYFGELMDDLRRRGLYDEALIVVTADHGEEFLDHGGVGHGRTLHGEQLRVPLLLKPPASWRLETGRRIDALVRHVDLWPTLLAAVGSDETGCHPNLACGGSSEDGSSDDLSSGQGSGPGPGESTGAGRSLWPLLSTQDRPATTPGPARRTLSYAHLDLDGRTGESLRAGRYKLICAGGPGEEADLDVPPDQALRRCVLYDLRKDPAETTDLAAQMPVLARSLRHRLRSFHGEASLAEELLLDEETDAQLRELGYL